MAKGPGKNRSNKYQDKQPVPVSSSDAKVLKLKNSAVISRKNSAGNLHLKLMKFVAPKSTLN